jgi:ketosteroid isomerase-like protein
MAQEGAYGGKGGQTEDALRAHQDRTVEAVLSHGRKGIEEVFHPNFRSVGGDYQFESREDFAKGVEEGKYKIRNIENRDQKVEFPAPNVAIVTSQRTVEGTIDGTDYSHTFQNTAVHTNEDGQWKVLLWGVTC